jgi:undecaprenyl-diphosphatase
MRVPVVKDEHVKVWTPRAVGCLLVAVLGGIGFGWLADAAEEGDSLASLDPRLTTDVVAHRTGGLTHVAQGISFVGEVPVLLLLTAIVALGLWIRTRRWQAGLLLVVGMGGAGALTYILKLLVGRHRPGASFVLGPIDTGFSFPSGHTLSSTVFFVLLAALVWSAEVRRTPKIAAAVSAVVLSLAMGLSRLYLGYHWGTDVLAGWIVAVTWLCLLGTGTLLVRAKYGVDRGL